MVSGSVSLPSRGPFHRSFTVLCSIGHWGVFSLTGWSPHVQSRFHVSRPTLDTAMSTHLSLTGLSPSLAGFPKTVLLNSLNQFRGPNPSMHARWFGLFRFRSPLLTESHVVFSSSGYLDVSVHRVPLLTLCIGVRILEVCSSGFPHSEISGSKDICSSPKLFAAYHVFHRLLVPRHPPYALSSMTNLLSFTGMNDRYTDIALSALA